MRAGLVPLAHPMLQKEPAHALALPALGLLQTGRSSSDNNCFVGLLCLAIDHLRHCFFTPCRRVVDAECLMTFVDPIQAIGGTDTGPDFILTFFDDFTNDVRIGHMSTSHSDHVQFTFRNRMPRSSDILDLGCVKDGDLNFTANFATEIKMG